MWRHDRSRRTRLTIQHKSEETAGVVEFARGSGNVTVKLKCRAPDREWRLLQAFIGSLMRHYRGERRSIEITLG